jgi:hypothetical protein
MNRPGFMVRLAGTPRMAMALLFGYAVIVLAWYQGGVPWWVALAAVGATIRTLSAVGQLRRYKAWAAEWQSMGEPLDAPAPAATPKKRRRWVRIAGVILLWLVIVAYLPEGNDDSAIAGAMTWLWMALSLYLACELARWLWLKAVRSKGRSIQAQQQAEAESGPVTWLLPPASYSPSRAEAQRNLPAYSVRLIGQG